VADNKIYVLGGASVTANGKDTAIQPKQRHDVLGSNDEYDPKTNSWRTRSPLPTPRSFAATATVGGKVYVIGGRIASAFAEDGSDTDVVEAYDPARDLWSRPLERMPVARSAAGVAMWRNRIVVAGGEISAAKGASTSAAIGQYDPEKNQWTALPAMREPRRAIATGLIGDRLYLIGGESSAPSTTNDALALDILP
jgi:N-acetylneuraminic acid mutarotase